MGLELYLIIILLALAGLYLLVPRVAGSYLKFRGKRVITCPETRKPAAVDMDVKRAVLTAVLGEPHLRLKDCSRWPEKKDCGLNYPPPRTSQPTQVNALRSWMPCYGR